MSFYKNINSSRLDNRQLETFLAIFIMILAIPALIVVLSNPIVSSTSPVTSVSTDQTNPGSAVYDPYISDTVGQVVTTGYTPVAALSPTMKLTVLVGLRFSQPTVLNQYLSDVQNPSSTYYHNYMTKQQFYDAFSPSQATYTKLVNFFTENGLTVSTYPDRVSIKLDGTVSQFENVFHTQIQTIRMNSKTFYAPVKSLQLNTDASSISAVIGLNNYFKAQVASTISQAVQAANNLGATPAFSNNPNFCNNVLNLTDNNQGGFCENQLLVGSDMQTAYQVNQLIASKGYAYNETVATILWAGNSSSGAPVAPFYPADLSTYFTTTLPASQPQPSVTPLCANYNQAINQAYICGKPVDGAYPQPDITSKNDSNQINFESTLDLEMIGSVAPGANAVEVYGPNGYSNFLDDCFATILNAQTGPLSHTVAISNSWGAPDEPGPWGAVIDPLWQQYTQEAAGLGITVLASTGDNANLNGEIPSAPASVGYNNFGDIAVGGTQTFLTGTPSIDGSGTTGILNQSVWFGTPYAGVGSQGGVSVSYPEPVWQQQSADANQVIKTFEPLISGRGTPDISAVAANMNITISYFKTNSTGTYDYNFRMIQLWGTSVASPLAAGVVADMDHYLGANEGFFNGLIYQLGQGQMDGLYPTTPPFSDVADYSANFLWYSLPGYDLVTGWGSINAYNFVLDQAFVHSVTFTQTGLETGASWSVDVDGAVLSSMGSSITFMVEPGTHYYTIYDNSGQYSSLTSGTFTMYNTNINVPVTFSNPASTGQGLSVVEAENNINSLSVVNFTFDGQNSDLPMAELFSVPQYDLVNSISLYLSGTGQVSLSIGTNPWQSDILAPITINVNGVGWYNVTFPTVALYGSVGYYFLNVLEGSQANSNVGWGFNIDANIYKPSVSYNDVGSYNNLNLVFPFNYYQGYDPVHPALYALGFVSNPPTIQGPTGTINTAFNGTTSLTWVLGLGTDVYGTQTYTIYKNGVSVGSGTWIPGGNVTFTSPEYVAGTFNYTMYVTDPLGGYASLTTFVHVASPPSSTSKSHQTPGFEVLTTVLGIMVAVTFYLRKRSRK